MEIKRIKDSFKKITARVKAKIGTKKDSDFGPFEERVIRHHGIQGLGTIIPAEVAEIAKMRKEGNKLAGRRCNDIMADDINNMWLIEETMKDSLDYIYETIAERTENTYLDFIANNLPPILEDIKKTYGSIPPVKRSKYVDIFAEEDEPHLIDTVSRLSPEEVYLIYLKGRKTDAMISFLERNFPLIFMDIKKKYDISSEVGP